VQFASHDYVAVLEAHQIQVSMSRPAHPGDNATCESFMKTLKSEEVDRSASVVRLLLKDLIRLSLFEETALFGPTPPVCSVLFLQAAEGAATRRFGVSCWL
jgi:transposase InsO family protein